MMQPTPALTLTPGTCYVHALPNEVLEEIFDCLLSFPRSGEEVPTPIPISHVSSHWRNVAINMASQWTDLQIRHTQRADILADMLSRSRQHKINLSVNLLTPITTGIASFSDTFIAIVSHISRVRSLKITTSNTIFHMIMRYLVSLPMPSLEHLELIQHGSLPICCFGPLVFNPNRLVSLRLERTTIECDSSCLSGLRSLDLIESSGTILDEGQLPSSTYPDTPTRPTMAHLNRLRIHATGLIPTTVTTPSFSIDSITYLELSHIRMITQAAIHPVNNLYRITLNPLLEELVLHDLDLASLRHLVLLIRTPVPWFPVLHSLTISSCNFLLVYGGFPRATPALRNLTLLNVGVPTDVEPFLREFSVWPLLTTFNLDGVKHIRGADNSATAVIPSQSLTLPS